MPVKRGDLVQRIHIYDGSKLAGKPILPVLEAVNVEMHCPCDGIGNSVVVELSDGTWEFAHNLILLKSE